MEPTNEVNSGATTSKENPLRAEKRKKLDALLEAGLNPYPHNYERSSSSIELKTKFEKLEPGEVLESEKFSLAGRLMTKRPMGKAAFFNIQDQQGHFQGYIRTKEVDEESQTYFKNVDIGDIVGMTGYIFKTKKGELSLHIEKFSILCKSIEPLPEKYHGISDTEIKYRQRYLDLIMDPQSRKVFETRSKIIREIRTFLDQRGFLEVETPVLQPIYGGASASPFTTHHNALDMQLYMKISPELYLKRLIVGGFDKVYEIGKNFRNEGIDRSHNPEFTMLEWYEAYTDYKYQMKQFEDLVAHCAKVITGDYKVQYQGKEVDFTTPWKRVTVKDAILEYGKIDVDKLSDDELFSQLKKSGSDLEKPNSRGEMVAELFELVAEHHLWNPTFVLDHPVEISPLTKSHREEKGLVERFEPFVAGMELGNAYTELNNPLEQRERLMEQESKRVVDEEAQPMDEDFVKAIEVGMPPTGGVGLGIERLVMLLTDSNSIRDILFFPTMKVK